MVSITVVKVFNKLPGMSALARAGVGAAVHKTGFEVEVGWKQRAPVDTGNYRNSIHTEVISDTEVDVTSGVVYGPHLEWGTRYMAARPSAHPAADAARPGFEAAVKAALSNLG